MAKHLNVVNLQFTADTSQAKAQIQSLQQSLTQLSTANIGGKGMTGYTQDVTKAISKVNELETGGGTKFYDSIIEAANNYAHNNDNDINKVLDKTPYGFHFAYGSLSAMLQSHKRAAVYIRPPFFDSQRV